MRRRKKGKKGAENREQYGERREKKIEKNEGDREEASEERRVVAHGGGKYGIPVSGCHHLSRGRDRARRYSGTF